MKKYTIIYTEAKRIGSHTVVFVRCDRVETDDITKLLREYNDVCYVFEGHPLDVI